MVGKLGFSNFSNAFYVWLGFLPPNRKQQLCTGSPALGLVSSKEAEGPLGVSGWEPNLS